MRSHSASRSRPPPHEARGARSGCSTRGPQSRSASTARDADVEPTLQRWSTAARSASRAPSSWHASLRALHWPLAFPEVFSGERPGFDVVVGNPPWEEVTVEELAFYARYYPGLRALAERDGAERFAELQAERPELAERLRVSRSGSRRCALPSAPTRL